jgi:uncharacterized protein DUF4412
MTPARLILAVLVAGPLTASAGVVIEGKEGEKTSRILLEGQKLRMESGSGSMIFDGATKRSVQLDPEKKTYVEFTKEDLARMNAMVAQSGRPKDKKAWTVKYEKSGKTEKALGQSCDVYRVVHGERPEDKEEMCLAPFGAFGVEKSDFAAFRAFGEFASEMGGGEIDRSWADIPGVPLITWDLEGGERKEEFRATKVEKRSIPASEFAVPAGWKKGPGFAEQMQQMEEMKKQMAEPRK